MTRVHLAERDFELSKYNADTHIVDARAGVVHCTPPRPAVAIVGAGHGRDYAPYDDPEWEVWSLNAVACTDRFGRLRVDRWFEMHERKAQNALDMQWVRKCPVPLYLPPVWAEQVLSARERSSATDEPDILQAVRYPLEAVEKHYGCYFACSFAYQIGLALLEGFTDIGLYGCELAFGTERERSVEFANVSWWVGFAEGRGITVHLPPHSRLGRHRYRYGIEYDEEKRDVEDYIDVMRAADRQRGVNTSTPYDSAHDGESQGG